MPWNDWMDKDMLKGITGSVILGLVGASLRAHKEKENFKAFTARVVFGGMLAGAMGYILSETNLDRLPFGLIMFAMGFGGSEIAGLIFNSGKKALQDSTGLELSEEESTKENKDEHPSDSKPGN